MIAQWLLVLILLAGGALLSSLIVATRIYVTKGSRKKRRDAMVTGRHPPVRVCSTESVDLSLPVPLVDGVTLVVGDRIMLRDQLNSYQNGIWVLDSSLGAVRASDLRTESDIVVGSVVRVTEGTTLGGQDMVLHVLNPNRVPPSLGPLDMPVALHFESWMDMVFGGAGPPQSTLVTGSNGRPHWVPLGAGPPLIWGTQERLSVTYEVSEGEMDILTINWEDDWRCPIRESIWYLYVTLLSGDEMLVRRYEVIVGPLSGPPRLSVLGTENHRSPTSKGLRVSLDAQEPAGGWWSPQEECNLTLDVENTGSVPLTCTLRLVQIRNATDSH